MTIKTILNLFRKYEKPETQKFIVSGFVKNTESMKKAIADFERRKRGQNQKLSNIL